MKIHQNPDAITDADLDTFEEGIDFSKDGSPIKDQRVFPKNIAEVGEINYAHYPSDVLENSFPPGEPLPEELIFP